MFSSSPFVIHLHVDLLLSIVVAIVVFVIANFVDFFCCPSSLYICFPPFVVTSQPLESWFQSPLSFAFSFSSISLMELTFVVHQHFASLPVLMLAL